MSAVTDSPEPASIRIDSERRALWVNEQPVIVGARAFDLLVALVERRDRIVGKNELLDVVWPRLVVEEANLHVQVSTLRKVLGPGAIATVPGRGYRFTGSIQGQGDVGAQKVVPLQPPPVSDVKCGLPLSLPALIGRADDLAALSGLVEAHRLVTITGAGGMGKTRVAMQWLHEHRQRFEHGIAWVDLSGLSDPALLVSAVAGALGLQTSAGDPLAGLVAGLRPLTLLVALDNAEHLVDEVARVVQAMLDGAPNVKVLVTSQVPLRRPGEQVYRLAALGVPDEAASVDEAMAHAAVQLFVARACAADRHFALTAENVAPVVRVCRQLDGLALAIELAAARVSTLGVTQLAAGLGERLRLLTVGSRGAPQRQQTLRAALAWSHALLAPAEQVVFRRLGVFAGGFALEMAQAVVAEAGGDGRLDAWAVVDALSALVDRSLVAADRSEPPRYRLLESARAFALEQLSEAGERTEIRRRHAHAVLACFAKVDADCWAGRIGVDAAAVMLEPDLDNAREALAWGLDHSVTLAVALAPALSHALTRDRNEERRRLWELTKERLAADLPDQLRAAWALGYALYWGTVKPALALPWARLAVELYRGRADSMRLYVALAALGTSIPSAASEERRNALREMCEIESPGWPPVVRFNGALAELRLTGDQGDAEAGERVAQRLRARAEEAGDSDGAHTALNSLAGFALTAGRADLAVEIAGPLEARLSTTRHGYSLALARLTLASALLAEGDVVRAVEVAERGWSLAPQFDLQPEFADVLVLLTARLKRPRSAARLLGYGEVTYARYGSARPISCARDARLGEQMARAQIGDDEFERLEGEGVGLRDEDVAALAFGGRPGE